MKTLKFLSFFLIITLLGCTEENNYYTTADGLGKTNVYIEGNITDAECVAKLANEVGSLTENIYVDATTQLTNIELDIPTTVRFITISSDNAELKTIKITGHGKMPNSKIGVNGGPKCQSVLINGITEILSFGVDNTYSIVNKTVICNDLEVVTKYFGMSASNQLTTPQPDYVFICDDLRYINKDNANPNNESCTLDGRFTTFSMNSLKEVGGEMFLYLSGNIITIPELEKAYTLKVFSSGMLGLNTLNFPKLTTVSYYLYCWANKLGTINLPVLTNCGTIELKDSELPSLNFNAPILNHCMVYISNIQLTTSGVNAVLNKFLTIQPPSGKGIDLYYEVAPTGQGIIDKQSIINQGNSVITD